MRERVVRTAGAEGDALLRALVDEHGRALLGYATRLTGDRGLAEDVVQETLLRAWRHAGNLDPARGPLRPWLFTVARNVVVDAVRAKRARPPEVGDAALTLVPVADDVERAVETWTVEEALAALSPEHRAVLIETYYRGSSVAEAATRLGIPPGTVKSRAFYALRELRLRLQEQGVSA
ncbi:MAG TPA: sigma-70 family RNA polymerase sigma factor [Mycobacteriales bacterium]